MCVLQVTDPHPGARLCEAHGPKAVLKAMDSTRWRDCPSPSNFLKRLDCGVFAAASLRSGATCDVIRTSRAIRSARSDAGGTSQRDVQRNVPTNSLPCLASALYPPAMKSGDAKLCGTKFRRGWTRKRKLISSRSNANNLPGIN